MRYVGKIGDPTSQPVASHFAIEKTYTIFAGKLRRFHGKRWYWYFSQPGLLLHNIKDALQFIIGCLQALWILIFWRPDVVFVKGGFVGLPVGLAAAFLRVPIVTHDSDTVPGLTNRILARYAHTLAVGAPVDQYPQYAKRNVIYTGVPVRSEFLQKLDAEAIRLEMGVPTSGELIAITGGSLGAVRMNTAVLAVLDSLLMRNKNRIIYWLTGAYGHSAIVEALQKKPYKSQVIIEKYSNNMPAIFSAATIIITRAGATTLAEIAVLHKPAVIIPNPLLTGGHQVKNGEMYKQYNAATVVFESELQQNPALLATAVEAVLDNEPLRATYRHNLVRLAEPQAARNIANIIITARGDARKVV